VRKPRVFLFDEPLSNLDASLRVNMRIELSRLHRELGTTMIYVTHDQVEAMTLGDRIAVFNAGRIEQVGTPGEVYNVASGTGRSVADIVHTVLARVGVDAEIVSDPALVRPVDVPVLVGDARKLQDATQWRAARSFDDIIDDLIHAATY